MFAIVILTLIAACILTFTVVTVVAVQVAFIAPPVPLRRRVRHSQSNSRSAHSKTTSAKSPTSATNWKSRSKTNVHDAA